MASGPVELFVVLNGKCFISTPLLLLSSLLHSLNYIITPAEITVRHREKRVTAAHYKCGQI